MKYRNGEVGCCLRSLLCGVSGIATVENKNFSEGLNWIHWYSSELKQPWRYSSPNLLKWYLQESLMSSRLTTFVLFSWHPSLFRRYTLFFETTSGAKSFFVIFPSNLTTVGAMASSWSKYNERAYNDEPPSPNPPPPTCCSCNWSGATHRVLFEYPKFETTQIS